MLVTFHEILLRNSTLNQTLNTYTFCTLTITGVIFEPSLVKNLSNPPKQNLMEKGTPFVPIP
jgi:hypothetical protein